MQQYNQRNGKNGGAYKHNQSPASKAGNNFKPMPPVNRDPKAVRVYKTGACRSSEPGTVRQVKAPAYNKGPRYQQGAAEIQAELPSTPKRAADENDRSFESKPLYLRVPSSNFKLIIPEGRRPVTRSRFEPLFYTGECVARLT